MCAPGSTASELASGEATRGLLGTQHELACECRGVKKSIVHSQTLPAMSNSPNPFGGNDPTGDVRSYPSRARFSQGNSPCQVLAIVAPPGANSSPQTNVFASRPPLAAYSHSASVGRSLPAQPA